MLGPERSGERLHQPSYGWVQSPTSPGKPSLLPVPPPLLLRADGSQQETLPGPTGSFSGFAGLKGQGSEAPRKEVGPERTGGAAQGGRGREGVRKPFHPLKAAPTCTGCLAVDQRWRLQPEPTALLLYKHKTRGSKAALPGAGQGRVGRRERPAGWASAGRAGRTRETFPSLNRNAEAPSHHQGHEQPGRGRGGDQTAGTAGSGATC